MLANSAATTGHGNKIISFVTKDVQQSKVGAMFACSPLTVVGEKGASEIE